MFSNRRFLLPLLAALALAALVGVSACGSSESHEAEGKSVEEAAEGEPVEVGNLSINVTFSRYLNRNDNEDSAYLVGQPPAGKGLSYFGVFVEVQNDSDKAQRVPAMMIHDATGRTYSAFPSESLYALQFGETVEPQEQIPVLDSTAQQGPIEGAIVIFKLGEAASENRPLTLHIEGFRRQEADVTLDL